MNLASLVDGAVELLGGDPVEPPYPVLELQVLLLVGGGGRAEEVPVAADHHVLLGQADDRVLVGLSEICSVVDFDNSCLKIATSMNIYSGNGRGCRASA